MPSRANICCAVRRSVSRVSVASRAISVRERSDRLVELGDGLLDDLRYRLDVVDPTGDLSTERERGVEISLEVEVEHVVEAGHRHLVEGLLARLAVRRRENAEARLVETVEEDGSGVGGVDDQFLV